MVIKTHGLAHTDERGGQICFSAAAAETCIWGIADGVRGFASMWVFAVK